MTPQFWAGLLTGVLVAPLALLLIAGLLSLAYDLSDPVTDHPDAEEDYF